MNKLKEFYHAQPPSLRLFVNALFQTLFAVFIASILFPTASGLVSVFLISFGLLHQFDNILLENKEDIWQRNVNPVRANLKTTLRLMAIFLGIFSIYFILVSYLPAETSQKQFAKQLDSALATLDKKRFNDFIPILQNNIIVIYLFFFFSFCYRAGAIFVITWNASVWGATFGYISHQWADPMLIDFVLNHLKLALAILPHLMAEAAGYILASMAGLFLAKAAAKYQLFSSRFNRVLHACLFLLLTSTCLVVLGVLLEAFYAPLIIDLVF